MLTAVVMAGCAEPQIVYPGTGAYEKRVRSFSVTPEAAERAANRYGEPSVVIDREYLFSQPYKYPRVDLEGVYVSGDTGAVEERQSEKCLLGGFWASQFYPHGMPDRLSEASSR
jgi:hypothetical protein